MFVQLVTAVIQVMPITKRNMVFLLFVAWDIF